MFKFRALLWALGLMMRRAARKSPEFREKLDGKDFVFQLQTSDESIVRHYKVAHKQIKSRGRSHYQPAFVISFKDPATGLRILTSKDKNAFMKGIQEKDIVITGDLSLVMWFQSISKYLKPTKKKKAKPVAS